MEGEKTWACEAGMLPSITEVDLTCGLIPVSNKQPQNLQFTFISSGLCHTSPCTTGVHRKLCPFVIYSL